jgi:alpha-galactosidase
MHRKGTSFMLRFALGTAAVLLLVASCGAQQIANDNLVMTVQVGDGSYQLRTRIGGGQMVLSAHVGAKVNRDWLWSNNYPQHKVADSTFHDLLGSGRELRVTCTGLSGKPDLVYVLNLYDQHPYAAIQLEVRNGTAIPMTVQALRSMEAIGRPLVDLGGPESTDRVLSDGYASWGAVQDLGLGSPQVHLGVGTQLIYNRESHQDLFLGALTVDRFVTLLRLGVRGSASEGQITSYSVDSTGTTELKPAAEQTELSLPLDPGQNIASERIMLASGTDYHSQLLQYGEAIRLLHRARVPGENLFGWWSWTSYYMQMNEGAALTNALWLAENLKSFGYDYFHIDESYEYARGEYTSLNASKYPRGMRPVGSEVRGLGLKLGLWTSPFEVSNRAWVYNRHKDWLVHTAEGHPILVGRDENGDRDPLYALDTTHPEAQEYLRQTYTTLVRSWGVHFIKLDFMDSGAIEGYRYRPNTTGFEALRIGLEVIRKAVGDDVILDKDGSPMLTPVGLVDAGRIAADTAHNWQKIKLSAQAVAAHFYMNRNFYLSDPDAFNLCREVPAPQGDKRPITFAEPVSLDEAQVSIMLSEVSGGMHEIGDDLPTLGVEKDRRALVENRDLLEMAKLSRASTPVDLLTYEAEDEQPSVFFLPEDQRQSILTIFNWTTNSRSHTFKLSDFGLPTDHALQAFDVLNHNEPFALAHNSVRLDNQPPHSVRVIKLIDSFIPPAAPTVTASVPSEGRVGEPIAFSAQTQWNGVPGLSSRWDFGDGTFLYGSRAIHTFTRQDDFTVRLTVEGLDGVPAEQSFSIKLTGTFPRFDVSRDRRYSDAPDP